MIFSEATWQYLENEWTLPVSLALLFVFFVLDCFVD